MSKKLIISLFCLASAGSTFSMLRFGRVTAALKKSSLQQRSYCDEVSRAQVRNTRRGSYCDELSTRAQVRNTRRACCNSSDEDAMHYLQALGSVHKKQAHVLWLEANLIKAKTDLLKKQQELEEFQEFLAITKPSKQ